MRRPDSPLSAGPRSVISGAISVLAALPAAQSSGQVAQLARATGLPRPTVYRLLGQLSDSGAVELRQDGTYGVAPLVTSLARHAEPVPGLRRRSHGVLAALRELTGTTVSLVVRNGTSGVALEMIPGREQLRIDSRAGAPMPRATAAGRVLWPEFAPGDRLRPGGAAVDQEDLLVGLSCFAAPLALPGGRTAAIQVAASTDVDAETFAPVVRRVTDLLARTIARASGGDDSCPLGGHLQSGSLGVTQDGRGDR